MPDPSTRETRDTPIYDRICDGRRTITLGDTTGTAAIHYPKE